jgi:hypothetical protein
MKRANAARYDLFKGIVTFVLIAILLLMLLRGCATMTTSPALAENSPVPNISAAPVSSPTATETVFASDSTETPTPASATVEPTRTPTVTVPSPTPTATGPEPTTAAETPPPTQVQNVSCNTSVPSRLAVGQKAQVVQRLNMRREASIDATIIQTNATKTQVEIIGGPVCTPVGDRAYLWWQIRLPGGAEGWSAESPLNEASYLLEPIP